MILGIDEVGRGPWAGPLVIGAVVLGGATIEGLTDSKKLTKRRREELDAIIREQAAACGLGWVSANEIDTIGLSEALRLGTRRAVEQIKVPYHEIIIDGTINFLADTTKGKYVTTMAKADLLVPSVSAASIIAKVARDNYMAEQDAIYEGYAFGSHVGYGTAAHRAVIDKLGVTPLHRLSFAPLAKYAIPKMGGNIPSSSHVLADAPTGLGQIEESFRPSLASEDGLLKPVPSNYMGAPAETETANYLERHGHTVVERNWKTKYCEIDIVSEKDGTIYFTEVKYRKGSLQGGGFAAITRKKLNQMKFAAKLYAQTKKLHNVDLLLAAASLTGSEPTVEEWVIIRD